MSISMTQKPDFLCGYQLHLYGIHGSNRVDELTLSLSVRVACAQRNRFSAGDRGRSDAVRSQNCKGCPWWAMLALTLVGGAHPTSYSVVLTALVSWPAIAKDLDLYRWSHPLAANVGW